MDEAAPADERIDGAREERGPDEHEEQDRRDGDVSEAERGPGVEPGGEGPAEKDVRAFGGVRSEAAEGIVGSIITLEC